MDRAFRMVLRFLSMAVSGILCAGISAASEPADLEAELDALLLDDTVAAQDGYQPASSRVFSGFLLSDSHLARQPAKHGLDSRLVKSEVRARATVDYTGLRVVSRVSLDALAMTRQERQEEPGMEDEFHLAEQARLDLREAYLGGVWRNTEVKVGQQLFNWGTGDAFHVTNYFDQLNLREMYVVDEEDRYRGVPALAVQYFVRDLALELVVTPVFAPPLFPDEDSFWAIDPAPDDTLDIRFDHEDDYSERASAALRAGGVVGGYDMHLSLFNGISNVLLFDSSVSGAAVYLMGTTEDDFTAIPAEAEVRVDMLHERVTTLGFDLASSLGRLSYRAEVAYTHDMIAAQRPGEADVVRVIREDGLAELPLASGDTFVFSGQLTETRREPFFASVLGVDYNYRGANGLLLAEWVTARYLRDRDTLSEPLVNNALLLRWEDRFLDEQLMLEVSTILGELTDDTGFIFNPSVGWDFRNGLTAEVGLYRFKQSRSRDDLMFELVDGKDIFTAVLRFEY